MHDANDPRRENSAPHIPPKRPRTMVPPLSHNEPNTPDIGISNPPQLGETDSDSGFQD